jgi:hypothetical protein
LSRTAGSLRSNAQRRHGGLSALALVRQLGSRLHPSALLRRTLSSRPALVAAPRDAGLSVSTSTVNHSAVAERALAYAPDAVTSDRSQQLAAELSGRRLLAA